MKSYFCLAAVRILLKILNLCLKSGRPECVFTVDDFPLRFPKTLHKPLDRGVWHA